MVPGVETRLETCFGRYALLRVLSRWVDRRLRLGENFALFVIGVNNSGTTALAKILESHPSVRTLPAEGHFLTKALPRGIQYGVTRSFSMRCDVFRSTEDNPSGTALRARYDWSWYYPHRPGILFRRVPRIRCVHAGCDRILSPADLLQLSGILTLYVKTRRRIGRTIEDAAEHWRRANEYMFNDIPHLRHSLWFRYRDLCARPEEHLAKLASFLELSQPFNPGS